MAEGDGSQAESGEVLSLDFQPCPFLYIQVQTQGGFEVTCPSVSVFLFFKKGVADAPLRGHVQLSNI